MNRLPELGFRRRCAWCGVELRQWQLNLCRTCKRVTIELPGSGLTSPPFRFMSRIDAVPDRWRKVAELTPEQLNQLSQSLLARGNVYKAVAQMIADERARVTAAVETVAEEFTRRADEADKRDEPNAYARRVVWDRASEQLGAALDNPDAALSQVKADALREARQEVARMPWHQWGRGDWLLWFDTRADSLIRGSDES